MSNTVIFEGEEWEKVPWENIEDCVGKEVLLYGTHTTCENEIVICSNVKQARNQKVLWFDIGRHGCTHCTFYDSGYHSGGCMYFPYLRVNKDTANNCCRCGGPSIDKWCYDTNRIEKLCARCKKRKRG